jgi:hypothetical protein
MNSRATTVRAAAIVAPMREAGKAQTITRTQAEP